MDIKKSIRKLSFTKKDNAYISLSFIDREALLERVVLSMPRGSRLLPKFQDEISKNYGTYAGTDVTEKFMRGLACMYPDKIKASFTLGLNEITVC